MKTAKKIYRFKPDYAVAPGETLKEMMGYLKMNREDLAERCGLSVPSLNGIITGEQTISLEIAHKLTSATGVPARFWENLELQYRKNKRIIPFNDL